MSQVLKLIFTIVSFFSLTHSIQGQELSIDLYGGVMNYQGDLVEGVVELSETNPAFGISFKYLAFKDIAIRGSLITGKISGDDTKSDRFANRGFRFESNITELSLTGEYHPFGKGRWNNRNELIKSISPYVYGGIGYSFSDPMVVGLPPTSEDLLDETNSRLVIPFGIGVQWTFSEQFYLGLEGGTRYLSDDYLDGVSQSGNPEANDWYLTGGIRIGYFISGEPRMF